MREILYGADAVLFLAAARVNRGEAVGAMTQVLRRIERPLEVGVVLAVGVVHLEDRRPRVGLC